MFTRGNTLILNSLLATIVVGAAVQTHGSVIVCECESECCLVEDTVGELARWIDANASHAALPHSCLPALALDASSSGPAEGDQIRSELDTTLADSSPGMMPSSTSSHSDGSGTGGAIESGLEAVLYNPRHGTLPPESRVVLLTGPVFRWFRPPRTWT